MLSSPVNPRLIMASSMILEDQHLGDTAAAILRLHSERDQARRPDPALMVKKFCEADRKSVTR